jgi:murein DD-endopeptidase MepM/ murein hydrolase activator NlpD
VPERPHYGSDLAAPIGTPVSAPADGVVSFAETGLHFEGALILIDHGQGLISAYLHLSKVGVTAGQRVKRGELIGAVGKEGRATGPHLCWRMKWRGRNMDPLQMVGTPQPV